ACRDSWHGLGVAAAEKEASDGRRDTGAPISEQPLEHALMSAIVSKASETLIGCQHLHGDDEARESGQSIVERRDDTRGETLFHTLPTSFRHCGHRPHKNAHHMLAHRRDLWIGSAGGP